MAFAFIRSQQSSAGASTSQALTVVAVPVNALVILNLKFTANATAITATDNASVPNTYALASGSVGTGTNFMAQLYGVAVTGGATSITVSWTTSASLRWTVDQFSGGMATNATVFDKVATNSGTGTSASVTLAPTNAGELVSAAIGMTSGTSGVAIGTNYTAATNNTSATTEYRLSATTSETAPLSWTGSTAWAQVAGAYIALPAAAGGAGNFMGFM